MKKIIILMLFIILICLGLYYKDDIYNFYKKDILKEYDNPVITNNIYSKNTNYNFVSLTTDFIAKDKEQLKDIFYTIINSGNKEFTFYCDKTYERCQNDFDELFNNSNFLSSINSFVHPFNSFTEITVSYYDDGSSIKLEPLKKYSTTEINNINNKLTSIIDTIISSDMNDRKKIETFHDYIINNSKYNENFIKANNILLNGIGNCSAYTDTMAIFLNRINVNNYKIFGSNHIWNFINLNSNWYHLDATYDDPVVSDGSNMLLKDAFLINTTKLRYLNNPMHNFDISIFSEAQ